MRIFFSVLIGLEALVAVLPASAQPLKEEIQTKALQYFIDHTNPKTGLVRDSAQNFAPTPSENHAASIAATGFGLAVVSNATERGLLPRTTGEAYALRTLRFAEKNLVRRKGWFIHFVDWSTGKRIWQSEYSTIDTALFIAGALYAGEIFKGETQQIASRLFRAVDFHDFMTDGGTKPQKRTLSLSYTNEHGYAPYQWDAYSEQMILLVLGLGHPTRPLPKECWNAWRRHTEPLPLETEVMGTDMPLFVHQYSQAFIDFRSFDDGYTNYFDNSVAATWMHRTMARNDSRYKTMREGFWGFSAGESPDGYRVYSPVGYEGTMCIGCAAGSAMFLPKEVLEDIESWKTGAYGKEIWGRYGLTDGVNLDLGWFSPKVLAITKGPEYMSVANLDQSTSIWRTFMKIPAVQRGLNRARSTKPGSSL